MGASTAKGCLWLERRSEWTLIDGASLLGSHLCLQSQLPRSNILGAFLFHHSLQEGTESPAEPFIQKFSIIHIFMVCLLSTVARWWPSGEGRGKQGNDPTHLRKDKALPWRSR